MMAITNRGEVPNEVLMSDPYGEGGDLPIPSDFPPKPGSLSPPLAEGGGIGVPTDPGGKAAGGGLAPPLDPGGAGALRS